MIIIIINIIIIIIYFDDTVNITSCIFLVFFGLSATVPRRVKICIYKSLTINYCRILTFSEISTLKKFDLQKESDYHGVQFSHTILWQTSESARLPHMFALDLTVSKI